jgi:hypothetical protein
MDKEDILCAMAAALFGQSKRCRISPGGQLQQ